MNTQNIISTPEITGNIGSCTTQVARVTSKRLNWYQIETTSIATNSCTGEVTTYQSWEYTFGAFGFGLGAIILGFAVIKLLIHMLTPKNQRSSFDSMFF